EDIPPYFAQTLLEPDDQRFQAVEDAFEQKTCARVFRRLNMRRRLFHPPPFPFRRTLGSLPAPRPFLAGLATMIVVMVATMLYTAPSFASGLAILLAGPHTGVIRVHGLPNGTTPVSTPIPPDDEDDNRIGMGAAQSLLQFPMYFPREDALPYNYTMSSIYIYKGADQSWAAGPIVEVDYSYPTPNALAHTTGSVMICEFKPVGKVMQLVGYGADHLLEIDQSGKSSGIYVDGQWAENGHEWVFGNRSELIYERDGIVFWILGFQHDGITGNDLRDVAASLYAYHPDPRINRNIIQSTDDAPPLLKGQAIYLDDPGNPNGPMLKVVGSGGQSKKN
ncbi:MAG: hypothetical protein J2P36_25265, partial [Ktedonobacteraceae bacterium]|nr:hypothetical protein [Ktedonobacteraceae bacterium]